MDLSDKNIETADIEISTDSRTFLDILHKEISPIGAYSTGKLKVKGKLTDLMKLQKLL
jgi:putative sterol carrier protein